MVGEACERPREVVMSISRSRRSSDRAHPSHGYPFQFPPVRFRLICDIDREAFTEGGCATLNPSPRRAAPVPDEPLEHWSVHRDLGRHAQSFLSVGGWQRVRAYRHRAARPWLRHDLPTLR
jgi:hypothetical protein